jgi:hypothetical protein
VRWAVDFRRLNALTLADRYPIPNLTSLLDKAGGHQIYSTLDAASAYFAIPMAAESVAATAFCCPLGLFEFLRMPFGLANAPSVYSRFVALALSHLGTTDLNVYLDDVLLYSDDLFVHAARLGEVLDAHAQAGILIKPSKTFLFQRNVHYLGHDLSATGIAMIDEYVQKIVNWPAPTTGKDLASCLGFFSYYRSFLPDYSKLTSDMNTQKYNPIVVWSDKMVKDFQTLKDAFAKAPIRAAPDFLSGEELILTTDYSSEAVGWVLSQVQDGRERMIAAGGRKCSLAERHYPSWKGEMMALITGIRKWDHLLGARRFKVCTDSSPLTHMLSLRMTKGIIQRWLQELASYQFHVVHKPGKLNSNADGISRSPQILEEPTLKDMMETAEFDQYVCAVHHRSEGTLEYGVDTLNLNQIEHDEEAALPLVAVPGQVNIPDWIMRQDEDDELKLVKKWVKDQVKPSKEDIRMQPRSVHIYRQLFESLYIGQEGLLRLKIVTELGEVSSRICVPHNLLGVVMYISHEMNLAGHFAARSSVTRARSLFYSPTLNKDLTDLVSVCAVCCKKQRKLDIKNNIPHSREAGYVGHIVNCDLVGTIKPGLDGTKYICSLQDEFLRHIHLIPLKDKTALSVAAAVYTYGCTFGFPDVIRTDNGLEFNNKTLIELCKLVGCQKMNVVAYNPQSNPVERFHRDLGRMLRSLLPREENYWCELLPTICSAYNNKVNNSTGFTPNMVFLGREVNLPSHFLTAQSSPDFECPSAYVSYLAQRYRRVQQLVQENQAATIKRNASLYTPSPPFVVGDLVNLFSKLPVKNKSAKVTCDWVGPYRVIRIVNPNIVEIVTLDLAKLFAVNVNGLQLWREGGPALPHPNHRLVTPATDLELLDVPLDHAPQGGDAPPDEGEGAPHDEGDDEENLPEVVLTGGSPLEASSPGPEVPETLLPLPENPGVPVPELVSPSYLPPAGTDEEVPDEFAPDLPDDELLPEEVLDPEPEPISSRLRGSYRTPEYLRDYDLSPMTLTD